MYPAVGCRVETKEGKGRKLPPGMWVSQEGLALMVAEGKAERRKNRVRSRALTIRRKMEKNGAARCCTRQAVSIAGVSGLGVGILGTVLVIVISGSGG